MDSKSSDRTQSRAATEGLPGQSLEHTLVQQIRVAVLEGPDAGRDFTSEGAIVVVGTHESTHLRLTDRSVSRFHCEIALTDHGVLLRDLGSRNGTTVDEVPIQVAPLRASCVVGIGRTRLRVDSGEECVRIPLSQRTRFGEMVACSGPMRAVFALLERAAPTDATILIEGETGTGKDVLANAIHAESHRREGPFVIVDCGAIPADLVESELFGHERGAFTGADSARQGAFAAAAGGTLFLDEVGELDLAVQPKLLRVLERHTAKRVGSDRYFRVDVRVVATTNRDLRADVNANRFRSDLYYRLAVVRLTLPPLRERSADLPLLVDAILESFASGDRPEAEELRSEAFYAELARQRWPGNVRELRNYIEACVMLKRRAALPKEEPTEEAALLSLPLRRAREDWTRAFERRYVEAALRRHGDNVAAAARAAGVDRAYFHRLLQRHGLR
jgi:transcriptional regulator with GAF, ATPase, and Fis domain